MFSKDDCILPRKYAALLRDYCLAFWKVLKYKILPKKQNILSYRFFFCLQNIEAKQFTSFAHQIPTGKDKQKKRECKKKKKFLWIKKKKCLKYVAIVYGKTIEMCLRLCNFRIKMSAQATII